MIRFIKKDLRRNKWITQFHTKGKARMPKGIRGDSEFTRKAGLLQPKAEAALKFWQRRKRAWINL